MKERSEKAASTLLGCCYGFCCMHDIRKETLSGPCRCPLPYRHHTADKEDKAAKTAGRTASAASVGTTDKPANMRSPECPMFLTLVCSMTFSYIFSFYNTISRDYFSADRFALQEM